MTAAAQGGIWVASAVQVVVVVVVGKEQIEMVAKKNGVDDDEDVYYRAADIPKWLPMSGVTHTHTHGHRTCFAYVMRPPPRSTVVETSGLHRLPHFSID